MCNVLSFLQESTKEHPGTSRMGSDGSAAGGGRSDLSEWQRSKKSRISVSPQIFSGTATGNRWTHRFPSREIVLRDCHVALLLAMTWIFATKLGCKKNLHPIEWRFVFALPIFPGSRPPSIVGVHELNFCVRDGNRWTLMTINTNSYGWLFAIFYIKALSS